MMIQPTELEQVQGAMTHQLYHTQKQIEALTRATQQVQDAESFKVQGTLLQMHAHEIQPHTRTVELADYRDPQHIYIIQLDPEQSIQANAQAYFQRYQKEKRGQSVVQQRLATAKTALQQQQARQAAFDPTDAEQVTQLKRQLMAEGALKTQVLHSSKAPEPAHPRRFYTSEHVLVEVGKNSVQNDQLTLTAQKNYYWMHAGGEIPGSHVVIHSSHPSEATLTQAANLTAYYSKGRAAQQVPVDVLKVSQLYKPKGAKPGLVYFTGQARTITVRPDPALAQQLKAE
ncbi:NFACT RNA binding domain-containing protein [Loigolactobacillus bifermentans]|nr:NFACT RNA binding domain-containing protein [Loigolactobacillus bifermentans]